VVLNALRETETSLAVYAHELDRNAALKAARDEAATAEARPRRCTGPARAPT
jgi:multidrug efflux system outer membrane protein